jgi:hypothetical protein
MQSASRLVLDGFELRTEAKVYRYPERYADERGATMWSKVMTFLAEIEASNHPAAAPLCVSTPTIEPGGPPHVRAGARVLSRRCDPVQSSLSPYNQEESFR